MPTTTSPVAVRIPTEIKNRLTRLAEVTGRSESHYIKEALLEHLDDLEDAALAAERWREYLEGDERAVPAEELYAELGL